MSSAIPAGWATKESKSRPGAIYYVNQHTGDVQWEVPTEEAKPSSEVRASHILRKHKGSRRPASWRCDNITQSKEESISQIEDIIKQLQDCAHSQGAQAMYDLFGKIASTESDCSSAQKGGDLGKFGRGQMQKSFEDATFALKVGQLSSIVDSDSGIHVILRTE